MKDPIGLELLSEFEITKESVVRSSLVYHKQMGAKEIEGVTPEILSGYFSTFGPDQLGGELNGIFSIPIAICNSGECISNHERGDRNYPCIVGENIESWWPSNEPSDEDYMAVSAPLACHAKAWSLMAHHQQYDFLAATGLWRDEAYDDWCDHTAHCSEYEHKRKKFPEWPGRKEGEKVESEEWPWENCKNYWQHGDKQETH